MNERQKVYEMLEGFRTAMLVTKGMDGRFEARPMQMAEVEPAGPIWFFTARNSRKADEVSSDPRVLLVFEDDSSQYLSIAGSANVVQDVARIRRLWKEPYRIWFPEGPDDQNLALVAIEPEVAEFWDSSGTNKLRYMFEATRAYVTGDLPRVQEGEQHGRTRI